jgi:hypothetical protein
MTRLWLGGTGPRSAPGHLVQPEALRWPLVIGETVKAVYDILLLIKFQKVRPPEEAGAVST